MKKLNLSQWHDGSVKPVHKGVYQKVTVGDNTIWYAYWNGKAFSSGSYFKNFDHTLLIGYGDYPVKKWRGIVKDKK